MKQINSPVIKGALAEIRPILAESRKAHYKANRDKIAEYHKAHYKANRDKIAERQKVYYKANRDKIAERQKVYYKAQKNLPRWKKIENIEKKYNRRTPGEG